MHMTIIVSKKGSSAQEPQLGNALLVWRVCWLDSCDRVNPPSSRSPIAGVRRRSVLCSVPMLSIEHHPSSNRHPLAHQNSAQVSGRPVHRGMLGGHYCSASRRDFNYDTPRGCAIIRIEDDLDVGIRVGRVLCVAIYGLTPAGWPCCDECLGDEMRVEQTAGTPDYPQT